MAKPSSTKSEKAEEAVRRYLTFLKDRTALVDQEAVARAQAQVDRAKDVIAEVLALARLERAQVVDEAPIRAAFVAAIGGWAADNDISVETLRRFGVPAEVLLEAKLMSRRQFEQERRAAGARPTSKPTPGQTLNGARSRTLNPAEAAALLDGLPDGQFTVAEARDATGLTRDAARSRVNRAVTAGLLVTAGVDNSDLTRKGKRPMRFERAPGS